MYGSTLFIVLTLLASLSTAMIYGVGGALVVHGTFQVGTLVSLAMLLNRLYGPITSLSNVQVHAMTALVSFDRVFEVLDLKPLIEDRPDAVAARARRPRGNGCSRAHAGVGSGHRLRPCLVPLPGRVRGLARVAGVHRPAHAGAHRRQAGRAARRQLHRPGTADDRLGRTVRARARPRSLTSCRGSTTPTRARCASPGRTSETSRSSRSTTRSASCRRTRTCSTTRSGRISSTPAPERPTPNSIEACRAAQIWDLIVGLPDGLDTIVGDRGYRLSGGEKQRVAIARLLLKAPAVVVLDEATAHLDSESEVAVQQALRTAFVRPHLAGHRPPAVHHPRGRPDPGDRRRPGP